MTKLKNKIIEANPEIKTGSRCHCPKGMCRGCDYLEKNSEAQHRTIRLADVLLVIKDKLHEKYKGYNLDEIVFSFVYEKWNLKDDNLDNQSKETKLFLTSLFVDKNT